MRDNAGRTPKAFCFNHRPTFPLSMTFQITVQPSGRSFSTQAGEVILAAAIRQGVGMPYGCKDGACGSCKCQKLSGEVVHGPHQTKALSPQEEADGWVLTCCAQPTSDVVLESRQVTEAGAFPIRKMPVRVSTVTQPAPDVRVLRLQLPATEPFEYHAGQYVEFLLRDGARRSYSMANAPQRQGTPAHIELHIRHMPGGRFTDHVFSALKEKDILRAEGPYGSFYLRDDTAPLVFLASGTGFAPIKALIEQLQDQGSTRPVVVYWGGRRPADLYMHDWMLEQAAARPNLRYVPVVSDAQPEDGWTGRTGFVHQAVMADLPDLSGHAVYACGAPIVVESARKDFTARCGLSPDAFYADAFTSALDTRPA